MPAMPDGARDGILKGMYLFRAAENGDGALRAQLLGSGAILQEVLAAQKMLAERYQVAADVWSVTSWKELRREALACERWNLLHPADPAREPYVAECLASRPGVIVASTDYMKALPDSIARWSPRPITSLGTDGFGRSEGRRALRDFFEVDARWITVATLSALMREGKIPFETVTKAINELGLDPAKPDPVTV